MSKEFRDTKSLQWTEEKGFVGRREKILYKDPASGTYCRLLEISPSFKAKGKFRHDFEEVVYILEGKLVNIETGEVYMPEHFAYFERGREHGPFETPEGCVAIEFRHFKK